MSLGLLTGKWCSSSMILTAPSSNLAAILPTATGSGPCTRHWTSSTTTAGKHEGRSTRRNHDSHHAICERIPRHHRFGRHHRPSQRAQEDDATGKPVEMNDPFEKQLRERSPTGKPHEHIVLDVLEGLGDVEEEASSRSCGGTAPFQESRHPPDPMFDRAVPNAPVSKARLPTLPEGPVSPSEPPAGDPDQGREDPDRPIAPVRLGDEVDKKVKEVPRGPSHTHHGPNNDTQHIKGPIVEEAQ